VGFGVEGFMRKDLMEDSVWRVRGCSELDWSWGVSPIAGGNRGGMNGGGENERGDDGGKIGSIVKQIFPVFFKQYSKKSLLKFILGLFFFNLNLI
jgi:hypothetical protein